MSFERYPLPPGWTWKVESMSRVIAYRDQSAWFALNVEGDFEKVEDLAKSAWRRHETGAARFVIALWLERWLIPNFGPTKHQMRRGTVFHPCEGCGATDGSFLDGGWFRCNKCGYPGK